MPRLIKIGAARLGLVLVCTVALLVAGVATSPGQRAVLSLVSWMASSSDGRLKIGPLDGSLFGDGHIERISLSDRRGVWLDIRSVRYSWSPLTLLSGRLAVDKFHVGAIQIARKPEAPERPAERADGATPSLIPLSLKQIQVDNLILGQALAGTSARFKIEASADLVDIEKGLSAKLAAVRLDEAGTRVDATFNFAGNPRHLAVNVTAAEPANGLIGTLLGLTDAPSLGLKLEGNGPLDGWHADWSTTAADKPFIVGRIRIDRDGERHRVASDLTGYLQNIMPASIKDLVAGKTTGSLIAFVDGKGGVEARHVQLMSDALDLRGSAGFTAETSHIHAAIKSRIARKDDRPVQFTMANGDRLSLGKLDLTLEIPDTRSAREISLALTALDIRHPSGTAAAIHLNARAAQSAPIGATAFDAERIAVKLDSRGIKGPEGGLLDAMGHLVAARLSGSLKAGVLTLDNLRAGDRKTYLVAKGRLAKAGQTGTAKLVIGDLGILSAPLGTALQGRTRIAMEADANVAAGSFSAQLDGTSDNLSLGESAVAGLFGSNVKFKGALARDRNGSLKLEKLDVAGGNLTVSASGQYSNDVIELDHIVDIPKLADLQPDLAGRARLEGRLNGTPQNLTSKVRLTTRNFAWRGQAMKDLRLHFDGKGPVAEHVGLLDIAGQIGPRQLSSRAHLTLGSKQKFAARDVTLTFGRNTATGEFSITPGGIPAGKLTLEAMKLSDLAFLIGQPVSGGLSGRIELSEHRNAARAVFDVTVPSLKVGRNAINRARISGDLKNYLTAIAGHASVNVAGLSGDGFDVKKLSVRLKETGERMGATASATINQGNLILSGSFRQQASAFDILLDALQWREGPHTVRLRQPARLMIVDREVRLGKLQLTANSGRIDVEGVIGPKMVTLDVAADQFPAKLANAFVPRLGAQGLIKARATVRGKPAAPIATLKATWANASVEALRENNLPPVTAVVDGRLREGLGSVNLTIQGAQALALTVTGDVALQKSPKSLNFRIKGDIPLSLANPALATRATRLSGRAALSGTLKGTVAEPRLNAQVSIPNATVDDPSSGLKLTRLVGLIDITERAVQIRKFTGESALGGTVSLGGRIVTAGNPSVALELALAGLKFNDRKLMAGEIDGNVKVAGPLDALSAYGSIAIKRMDITVPAAVPRSITSLNVKHVNAPERLQTPAQSDDRQSKPAPPLDVALNLRIDAANRIFVKGRGLDAQLGGGLTMRGTTSAPFANGGFQMERGRLDILGRRLDFRHGRIQFDGTLEPLLDLEAAAKVDDVTILVTITGSASSPVFKFSSEPELPEEEVIARLLFNKALVGLSPLQLVQLASEVDKIGGLSSGPGLFDKLKQSVGVDVLDVSTDKEGKATVSAGSYLTDKTFVGVRQGTNAASSRVVIDHDLTKNLKARGEVGSDGNSKLGIGFEWNY